MRIDHIMIWNILFFIQPTADNLQLERDTKNTTLKHCLCQKKILPRFKGFSFFVSISVVFIHLTFKEY